MSVLGDVRQWLPDELDDVAGARRQLGAAVGFTSTVVTTPLFCWNSSPAVGAWSSWRSARMPGLRPKM
jgi:hypothetical protein